LESLGAVDLACLEDYALAPDSRAHYLVRCDGDVHDYCTFSANVVPALRARGWIVEIASDYPYRVADAEGSSFYASLARDRDRPDWFALELGIDLDGRRVNLL